MLERGLQAERAPISPCPPSHTPQAWERAPHPRMMASAGGWSSSKGSHSRSSSSGGRWRTTRGSCGASARTTRMTTNKGIVIVIDNLPSSCQLFTDTSACATHPHAPERREQESWCTCCQQRFKPKIKAVCQPLPKQGRAFHICLKLPHLPTPLPLART